MNEVQEIENRSPFLPRLSHLSEWMVTAHLDGSVGKNREQSQAPQIDANNDHEAIQRWLSEYQHKSTTFRTYQKEAERFLLWCVIQQKKPLSSIDRDDIESYSHFLDDPQPRELWCGKKGGRKQKRGHPDWRPFSGPLTAATKMTALSIIDSLFTYLTDARYLAFNPFSLIRKRRLIHTNNHDHAFKVHERILEPDEWHALLETLEKLPDKELKEKQEKERLRFLLAILYFLGLRINELATHTWNAFRKMDDRWWFFVRGKGDKLAKIPVNDELLRAVIYYRVFLKRSPLPDVNEKLPIVTMLDKNNIGISARQMNKLLKKLSLEAAKIFMTQPEKERKLKKFSAHWLRHLSASMQDRAGISFKHIRSNLRHENDETTRLYVHDFDRDRHSDMQKLKIK
jgi:site-specific recombinase XerD